MAVTRLMVDPGHGGPSAPGLNYGATGNGLIEKDLVLRLGLKLRDLAPDVVRMTRSKDVNLALTRRAEIANAAEAEIFLSLHCNGYHDPSARGYEDFHASGSTKGAELTRSVHDQVMTVLPFDYPDRGVKHANYTVLTHTRMPAVLVELGFITNGADAAWLAQDKNLEAIAQALLLGCNVEVEKPDPKPVPSPPDGVIASKEVLVVESREIKDVIRSLHDSIEMLDNIIKG